ATTTDGITNDGLLTTTDIDVIGSLDVDGATTTDNITNDGLITTDNANVNANLDVDGATTTDGITNDGLITTTDIDVTGSLDVDGATTTDNITNDGLITTDNANVNANLDVDGVTTTDGITNDGLITTTNANVTTNLDVDGATTTDGITNDGLLTTTNANVTSDLDVDGVTTVDDFTAVGTASITGTSTINTSGVSATTIGTNGNTTNLNSSVVNMGTQAYNTVVSIGSTQTNTTVTTRGGNSTLSIQNNVARLTSSNNGLSTYTNGQVIGTDYTLVNGNVASQALVTGQTTSNVLVGNTLVDGDMYINGTLTYTSSTSATTTVTSGVSELPGATLATIGAVKVDNSGGVSVNSNGEISPTGATGPTAGIILTNGYGETHGLAVTESQVTLSGGTRSSSMTLDNNGATFSNSNTGLPVQVHGVADATAPFDAVNYRQLNEVKRGLAATTAMTNIPAIDMGKKFSVGVGLGGYDEETAFALGSSMRLKNNFILKASVGHSFGGNTSSSNTTWGVGSSFSW
ncbi:MAG: YadA C-terminal domain-containing protein, partial [Gammaproteobacteria bacterium]|nr:YadA C-terminal domain-containing protein [Gammaproteobacteria bacterium]